MATPSWASVERATSDNAVTSGSNTREVVIAADGSQYFYGRFDGSVTIGGTTITAGVQENNFYLAKKNADGTMGWIRQFQATKPEYGASLTVDAAGNAYLGGFFDGSLIIGNQVLTAPAGILEAFIMKFDSQGTLAWSKAGGTTTGNAYVHGVGVDAAGNVYVAGDFYGSIDFGGGNGSQLTSPNGSIFLYKLSPSGALIWVRNVAGSHGAGCNDVAVDAAGNVYLAGSISGSATFGTVVLTTNNTDSDVFAAKYDAEGNVLWAQHAGTKEDDYGSSIAVDATGGVVVSGSANTTFTNGSTESEGYLVRFTPQGNLLWARQIAPTVTDEYNLFGVANDGRGGIYTVGMYKGTLALAGTTLTATSRSPFVARYDEQGNAVWLSEPTYSAPTDAAIFFDVASGANGNVYLTGAAKGNVSFGTVATSGAGADAIIAKLSLGTTVTATRPIMARTALVAYPNPASEVATVVLPSGGGQLVLLDALGRTVRQQALPAAAGSCQVSLKGLVPGIYQVRATMGNGQTATTRLVVR